MTDEHDIPVFYFARETIHYPICQCGEIIRNDDPYIIDGEIYCDDCKDECASDLINIES